jgi:UDP-N-acetylmuramyl-tripeptide synthetase
LRLTGITGTDGKTSTAHFLHQILLAGGRRTAALGTLGIRDERGPWRPWAQAAAEAAAEPARAWQPTTPEAPLFQATLAELRDRGVTDAVAEISSHALAAERHYGTQFAAVALTHVSSDHLDFHGDAAGYRAAKARLFDRESRGGCLERRPVLAVLNLDDDLGRELAQRLGAGALTYGRGREAVVRLEHAAADAQGIALRLAFRGETVGLRTAVAGEFHVANLLAAATIAYGLGLAPAAIAAAAGGVEAVPGRFELVRAGQPFAVVVDYAHTADGLARLLRAARRLGEGALVAVFGCGGDRDRQKRAPMGAVAGRLADRVIITNDNPRSESPAEIAAAVEEGVRPTGTPVEIELDRRAAFARALEDLRAGDILVAAGRGAEGLQVFADRIEAFDDRDILRQLLAGGAARSGRTAARHNGEGA